MGMLVQYNISVELEVQVNTDQGSEEAHKTALEKVSRIMNSRNTPHGQTDFAHALANVNISRA